MSALHPPPDSLRRRIPQRRCVSCRQSAPRTELIRVVRRPDGEIAIDQRADGRGAYLHRDPGCIARAAAGRRPLSGALRRPVSDAVLTSIAQRTAPRGAETS